jgi:hypothetical protein
MGVGSEVYSAVRAGRRGIGIELKASYFHQAEKNMKAAMTPEVKADEFEFPPSVDVTVESESEL